jgi:hypothetical protein
MWGFLTAGGNVPFVAALLLMLLVGLVEVLGFGGGLSADGDGDLFDSESPSILSWLNMGRLPLLMLIVVFLFGFGMIGVIGQRLLHGFTAVYAPAWISAPLAFVAALPLTRLFSRLLSRIMPHDETSAVSRDTLVGRVAVVVTGEARPGNAAQSRVRDEHGQVHYVMVEPDDADVIFAEGDSVILVRMAGARFFAIPNTSPSLRDAIV